MVMLTEVIPQSPTTAVECPCLSSLAAFNLTGSLVAVIDEEGVGLLIVPIKSNRHTADTTAGDPAFLTYLAHRAVEHR